MGFAVNVERNAPVGRLGFSKSMKENFPVRVGQAFYGDPWLVFPRYFNAKGTPLARLAFFSDSQRARSTSFLNSIDKTEDSPYARVSCVFPGGTNPSST